MKETFSSVHNRIEKETLTLDLEQHRSQGTWLLSLGCGHQSLGSLCQHCHWLSSMLMWPIFSNANGIRDTVFLIKHFWYKPSVYARALFLSIAFIFLIFHLQVSPLVNSLLGAWFRSSLSIFFCVQGLEWYCVSVVKQDSLGLQLTQFNLIT